MNYEDLLLQLAADPAGRYTVRVARSPAGESEPEPLAPPISPDEIDRLGDAYGRAARDVRVPALAVPRTPDLAELGARLFGALFVGSVRNRYHESLGRVLARDNCGLRIRIEMALGRPDMARLHAIPWEYLCAVEDGHFLGLSRDLSIVRYLDLALPADRPPVPAPLAILVVAGQELASSDLALTGEHRAMVRAWDERGSVRITLLPNPTIEALRDALLARDYHVLHFMGHGGFDRRAGEGSLAFRNEEGRRIWVSGADLAAQLRDRTSLRLIFLNACWTARAISSGPYAGVATALLGAGVPAVLAMQFAISDAAALAFSRVFYRRIAQGDTIDAAVTEGRMAIRRLNHPTPEWGTPVLFERLSSGRIVVARLRPRAAWRTAAVGALLGAAALLAVWWVRTQPASRRSVSASQAPIVSAVAHERVHRAMAQSAATGAPLEGEPVKRTERRHEGAQEAEAAPSGPARTPSREEARQPSAPRTYTLTALRPIFIQELRTSVSAEFSQIGRETYLTLHLMQVGGPALHQAVLGPTDLDLGPGKGRLLVQSINWEAQTVQLAAEAAAH